MAEKEDETQVQPNDSTESTLPDPSPEPPVLAAVSAANEETSQKKNFLQLFKSKLVCSKVNISLPSSYTREIRKPMCCFMNIVGLHEG